MINFPELRDLLRQHLTDTVGELDDFEITFAKLDSGNWRANIEFVKEGESGDTPESAMFEVNAQSGAVVQFRQGYTWRE